MGIPDNFALVAGVTALSWWDSVRTPQCAAWRGPADLGCCGTSRPPTIPCRMLDQGIMQLVTVAARD
jgi:hypothetical protein